MQLLTFVTVVRLQALEQTETDVEMQLPPEYDRQKPHWGSRVSVFAHVRYLSDLRRPAFSVPNPRFRPRQAAWYAHGSTLRIRYVLLRFKR